MAFQVSRWTVPLDGSVVAIGWGKILPTFTLDLVSLTVTVCTVEPNVPLTSQTGPRLVRAYRTTATTMTLPDVVQDVLGSLIGTGVVWHICQVSA